jgi:hypothetical protein
VWLGGMRKNREKITFVKNRMEITIQKAQFQKMMFLMNAIENGWTVKKRGDAYIFSKKHEGRRQIFQKEYLETFIRKNLDCEDMMATMTTNGAV